MADYDEPNFFEDGARPENEGGDREDGADEGGVQQPAGVEPEQEVLRWLNWKLIAGVGVVIGGVVMAYFLYNQHKKIQHLQRSVEQGVSRNSKDISAINENVLNTQRFIVDMANRQKWPWPFNNRVKGLEEEFGLPKK